jgi:hypothetical protein
VLSCSWFKHSTVKVFMHLYKGFVMDNVSLILNTINLVACPRASNVSLVSTSA